MRYNGFAGSRFRVMLMRIEIEVCHVWNRNQIYKDSIISQFYQAVKKIIQGNDLLPKYASMQIFL